jgi:3-methyl-2-oxobutanoate hydroxymethyltransferase
MSLDRKKINAVSLRKYKDQNTKIVALTAADFLTARLLDESGVDVILVGDSLGTTWLGYPTTVSVSMREMLHHLRAVSRAQPKAMVVVDMPFGSYHQSVDQAVRNAVRLVQEGKADAVKLEGGVVQFRKIQAIVETGIPVMGHIGLLPQSFLTEGTYRVKGKSRNERAQLKKDFEAVQKAGAFACVLEYIHAPFTKVLNRKSKILTIGIGSGPDCDGQVLVTSDMLGLPSWGMPRAVRQYANLRSVMGNAFSKYVEDVKNQKFPTERESL